MQIPADAEDEARGDQAVRTARSQPKRIPALRPARKPHREKPEDGGERDRETRLQEVVALAEAGQVDRDRKRRRREESDESGAEAASAAALPSHATA